jgi:hypothetical protein
MATLTDRTYFPPLEECLSGRRIILYVALSLYTAPTITITIGLQVS